MHKQLIATLATASLASGAHAHSGDHGGTLSSLMVHWFAAPTHWLPALALVATAVLAGKLYRDSSHRAEGANKTRR